jgi:DNA-binding GntR family transcriptional regulator
VSRRVQEVVRSHIDSVEILEVLLLLVARPEMAFSAERVSEQLGTATHFARNRLRRLQDEGLVQRLDNDCFRVARDPGLLVTLSLLAETYRARPSDVVGLIHARPSELARVLEDTFNLQREAGAKKGE